MLFKYVQAGKINLIGIMTNKDSPYSAEYIDVMETWYGHTDIPIGIVRNGADCEDDAVNYAKSICLQKDNAGNLLFKRTLAAADYTQLPDAHTLYRRLLAAQPDSSVTIISIGFSTNLARLLATPSDDVSPLSGKELVARKVKQLVTMAGCFNDTIPQEYNVLKDIAAAKAVFGEWPTPIVTSPFEVGIDIYYPGSSIEQDFGWAPHHPMVEAYKSYSSMPYDQPTWDLTAVLYAVEGAKDFTCSPAGRITVLDDGRTSFTPDPQGMHRYLTVDAQQAEQVKQRLVALITQRPHGK
jgi:inosine-uridine nucleoside N-ribohydrolase